MPPPSRPGKGGGDRGGRLPAAQGEQGARPGGAARPGPGRGHRPCQPSRCRRTSQLMAGLPLGGGRGRPRTRPEELCRGGACDTREIREDLRRRGIRASVPENPRGAAQAWPALSLLPAHLPGGQGGSGTPLRLAEGRVPEAGPAPREALERLPTSLLRPLSLPRRRYQSHAAHWTGRRLWPRKRAHNRSGAPSRPCQVPLRG